MFYGGPLCCFTIICYCVARRAQGETHSLPGLPECWAGLGASDSNKTAAQKGSFAVPLDAHIFRCKMVYFVGTGGYLLQNFLDRCGVVVPDIVVVTVTVVLIII